MQDEVLGPLVRVVEEAAGNDPWALIGAASCRLQRVEASSPNLEFMTTEPALHTLADMLDVPPTWGRGTHLAAQRLHFMRGRVPVFVFANPTFHGRYESLTPMEVPSLWDARLRIVVEAASVLVTPREWELLLAVVLGADARGEALGECMRRLGYDGRLLTRLLRESHVEKATEEAVWDVLERDR